MDEKDLDFFLIMIIIEDMRQVYCRKCKYEWTPRVEQPRECPCCKSRLWYTQDMPQKATKPNMSHDHDKDEAKGVQPGAVRGSDT